LDVAAGGEISVLFVDDPSIRDLNRDYRGIDKPTDVLSFAQDDPLILGDIVVSVETAQRQASASSWPIDSELSLLLLHGLLHLVGRDDETDAGAAAMENETRSLLADCGIALPPADHPFFQSMSAH
jgi:probable rRNA maturation factor